VSYLLVLRRALAEGHSEEHSGEPFGGVISWSRYTAGDMAVDGELQIARRCGRACAYIVVSNITVQPAAAQSPNTRDCKSTVRFNIASSDVKDVCKEASKRRLNPEEFGPAVSIRLARVATEPGNKLTLLPDS
jgi:hypothetical protein